MSDLNIAFQNTEAALRERVLERAPEIHTAMLALIGRQHHFVLGPPGIAKSLLVDLLVDMIEDARSFSILMTRYTQPEEVFGGPDLKRLSEDGKFQRVVDNMMPDSDIVFLDEVFKANSAILNATLKAINERKFNLGDQVIDVPLHSLFAASNELPQSGELDALFDRLHFKHFASNIQETTNFVKLLSMNDSSAVKPTLSLDIINQAHIAASKVEVGDEVLEAFVNLKEQLSEENIVISDRRWRECVRIVRSEAFYNGHEVAEVEDMRPLMHALWTDTDQIKIVRRLVLDLANPLEREASELLDELSVAYEQFEVALRDADNKQQRAAHAVEMYKKLEKAKNRYKDLRKRNQGKDSDVFDDLGTKIQTVGKSLLKGLGHDDEEDIDE